MCYQTIIGAIVGCELYNNNKGPNYKLWAVASYDDV